jgi:hypothetical protein
MAAWQHIQSLELAAAATAPSSSSLTPSAAHKKKSHLHHWDPAYSLEGTMDTTKFVHWWLGDAEPQQQHVHAALADAMEVDEEEEEDDENATLDTSSGSSGSRCRTNREDEAIEVARFWAEFQRVEEQNWIGCQRLATKFRAFCQPFASASALTNVFHSEEHVMKMGVLLMQLTHVAGEQHLVFARWLVSEEVHKDVWRLTRPATISGRPSQKQQHHPLDPERAKRVKTLCDGLVQNAWICLTTLADRVPEFATYCHTRHASSLFELVYEFADEEDRAADDADGYQLAGSDDDDDDDEDDEEGGPSTAMSTASPEARLPYAQCALARLNASLGKRLKATETMMTTTSITSLELVLLKFLAACFRRGDMVGLRTLFAQDGWATIDQMASLFADIEPNLSEFCRDAQRFERADIEKRKQKTKKDRQAAASQPAPLYRYLLLARNDKVLAYDREKKLRNLPARAVIGEFLSAVHALREWPKEQSLLSPSLMLAVTLDACRAAAAEGETMACRDPLKASEAEQAALLSTFALSIRVARQLYVHAAARNPALVYAVQEDEVLAIVIKLLSFSVATNAHECSRDLLLVICLFLLANKRRVEPDLELVPRLVHGVKGTGKIAATTATTTREVPIFLCDDIVLLLANWRGEPLLRVLAFVSLIAESEVGSQALTTHPTIVPRLISFLDIGQEALTAHTLSIFYRMASTPRGAQSLARIGVRDSLICYSSYVRDVQTAQLLESVLRRQSDQARCRATRLVAPSSSDSSAMIVDTD